MVLVGEIGFFLIIPKSYTNITILTKSNQSKIDTESIRLVFVEKGFILLETILKSWMLFLLSVFMLLSALTIKFA